MKYIIVLLVLLISSCDIMTTDPSMKRMPKASYKDLPISLPKSINTAWLWTVNNTCYFLDSKVHGVEEYWQSPYETYLRGSGDCEDYAILLGYFAYKLGYDVYIILYEVNPTTVHAITEINGTYYEPQTYGKKPIVYNIYRRYSFLEAIQICNKDGSY
jgi:hypothetical protein